MPGARKTVVNKLKVRWMVLLIAGILAVLTAAPTYAAESHLYAATHGLEASFYLIGGRYDIYVYAKRPIVGPYAPESRSCLFGGNFQRVWPTHEVMSLGSGITISTIVPYKIGPRPITLPAGLYAIYIPALTTCDWKFVLSSTSENSAGIAPVQMLRRANRGLAFSPTASVNDQVQFYTQVRTDHDAREPVSGTLEIIHDDRVVQTFPLKLGTDDVSKADVLFSDIQWEQSDTKYLGKNTAKFLVKIGSAEFTSVGEFELTR
jgi:hypothetical protein